MVHVCVTTFRFFRFPFSSCLFRRCRWHPLLRFSDSLQNSSSTSKVLPHKCFFPVNYTYIYDFLFCFRRIYEPSIGSPLALLKYHIYPTSVFPIWFLHPHRHNFNDTRPTRWQNPQLDCRLNSLDTWFAVQTFLYLHLGRPIWLNVNNKLCPRCNVAF